MAQTQKTQTKNPDVLSNEELRAIFEFRAKKLGVLLATADMPDEQKDAWASLVPSMTLRQIDDLTDILEADYANNATEKIDDYFSLRMQEVAAQFAKEDAEEARRIDEQMQSIETVYKKLGSA